MKITHIENIRSLCILRLSAIGDVTHVLPVVATLQKANPKLKITWIIGKIEHKLVNGMPGVEFIIYEKNRGKNALNELKNTLKSRIFDVLFHMQYSFRANRVAWKIPAKIRIGFDKKRSREFHGFRLTNRIPAIEQQHVLDSFMEFPLLLGAMEKVYEWNISTNLEEQEFANKILHPTKPNVIINPCSSMSYRDWRVENYIQIIDFLQNKYAAHVIICGSPNSHEIATADKIAANTCQPCCNIAGKDTLKKLFALMQQADLVISSDSGPLHIANAAGTAVIGLHASTTAKRSGAYQFRHLAVDCFAKAAKKYENTSADKIKWGHQIKHPDVMQLVSVAAVKAKVVEVLDPIYH